MSITPGASTAPSGADYDDDDYDVVNAEQIEGVAADDDDENTEDVDEVASDDDIVRPPRVVAPTMPARLAWVLAACMDVRNTVASCFSGFRGAGSAGSCAERAGAAQAAGQDEAAAPRRG